MIHLYAYLLIFLNLAFSQDTFLNKLKDDQWGKIPVTWWEDDRFPNFNLMIFFDEGGINDPASLKGLTSTAMNLLTSGTEQFTEKEIQDFFDFYGAKLQSNVTHEYVTISLSGLLKDREVLVKKLCHLMGNTQYPQVQLDSYIQRSQSHLNNLVTSHAQLADRVFRSITLDKTPYQDPIDGTLASLAKIKSEYLQQRLKHFQLVNKRVYVSGPEGVTSIKEILLNDCGWGSEDRPNKNFWSKRETQVGAKFYFVPVPNSNQAQIRIGRWAMKSETHDYPELMNLLSSYLGGGFTSKLIQELRVKRGLTYSAGAHISLQKDYSRIGVSTFSKNESVIEALKVLESMFKSDYALNINQNDFVFHRNRLKGAYPFSIESSSSLLSQIMYYQLRGKKLEDFVNFPEVVDKLKFEDFKKHYDNIFNINQQNVLILGDQKLLKDLKKWAPNIKVLNYKDYL